MPRRYVQDMPLAKFRAILRAAGFVEHDSGLRCLDTGERLPYVLFPQHPVNRRETLRRALNFRRRLFSRRERGQPSTTGIVDALTRGRL